MQFKPHFSDHETVPNKVKRSIRKYAPYLAAAAALGAGAYFKKDFEKAMDGTDAQYYGRNLFTLIPGLIKHDASRAAKHYLNEFARAGGGYRR
jgi:hypothetical protein